MKPSQNKRSLLLLAACGLSLLAFTGCAPVGDVAIKVDDTEYSSSDVELFTDFRCGLLAQAAENPELQGQVPAITRQQARNQMATFLVDAAIDSRVAADAKVTADPAGVTQQVDEVREVVNAVATGEDRERLLELVTEFVESQVAIQTAIVAQIGEETLNQLGQEGASQAIQETAQTARAVFAEKLDIDVDPAYGLSNDGLAPDAGGSSLSVPVSDFAKSATSAQLEGTFVDALPRNQRCS